jgi:hypothetical protein
MTGELALVQEAGAQGDLRQGQILCRWIECNKKGRCGKLQRG